MKARVLVQTYADCSVEGDEIFLLRLSNPTDATLADSEATVTINNTAIAPHTLHARRALAPGPAPAPPPSRPGSPRSS